MTSARLIVTYDCHKNCAGCCNKDWKGPAPRVWGDPKFYDEILITGGEPLLFMQRLCSLIFYLRMRTKAKIYVYTAMLAGLKTIAEIADGITLTLHDREDAENFRRWSYENRNWSANYKGSFRLNVFEVGIVHFPWNFKAKVVKWIPDCPLPPNEELLRLQELWRVDDKQAIDAESVPPSFVFQDYLNTQKFLEEVAGNWVDPGPIFMEKAMSSNRTVTAEQIDDLRQEATRTRSYLLVVEDRIKKLEEQIGPENLKILKDELASWIVFGKNIQKKVSVLFSPTGMNIETIVDLLLDQIKKMDSKYQRASGANEAIERHAKDVASQYFVTNHIGPNQIVTTLGAKLDLADEINGKLRREVDTIRAENERLKKELEEEYSADLEIQATINKVHEENERLHEEDVICRILTNIAAVWGSPEVSKGARNYLKEVAKEEKQPNEDNPGTV